MQTIHDDDLASVSGGGAIATHLGQLTGFGAGVAVTGALGYVPSWSTQVPGKPDGFQRRHEAVVGPKVSAYARTLGDGVIQDFVSGVGTGATAAPGWAFDHGL